MNRRIFLKGIAGILAAGVAPAAIGSNILMPVRSLVLPAAMLTLYGDDLHDDTTALQALIDGASVIYGKEIIGGQPLRVELPYAKYRVTAPLILRDEGLSLNGFGSTIRVDGSPYAIKSEQSVLVMENVSFKN